MPAQTDGWVRFVDDIEHLGSLSEAWSDLARRALEPNPFFEPSFLMPLVRARGWIGGLTVVVVKSRGNERLIGLVPLLRRGLRSSRWSPWLRALVCPDQPYGFLATPLLDVERAEEAIHTLLDALDAGRLRGLVLELRGHGEDGPFARLLEHVLAERRQPALRLPGWERGLFRPGPSIDAYLARTLSPRRLRELRRQWRRLEATGSVRLRRVERSEPIDPWCEAFLALEAAGWKGRLGTAMASRPRDAAFFRTMCAQRHGEGRLLAETLELDGRPIAASLTLLAAGDPSTGFVFKITHDEAYRRFGPGTLLELAQLTAYHADDGSIRWLDSCTGQGREALDKLWAERRRLGHRLLFAASPLGRGALEAIRLARAARARWRRSVDHPRVSALAASGVPP